MKLWADKPSVPQDVDEAVALFNRRMRLWEIGEIMDKFRDPEDPDIYVYDPEVTNQWYWSQDE